MSGICGILEFSAKSVSEERLVSMSNALTRRGPDKESFFVDGNIGFAHRLLEVSGDDVGFASDGSGVHLAVDGNLYNLADFQNPLVSGGEYTTPDAIFEAYHRFGLDFLMELEGAFAFVLFDKQKKRLILARDKMGIKPLYYAFDHTRLIFGSEIRTILSSGYLAAKLDTRAFADYLTFQHTLGDKTFFQGIRSLAPATFWMWEANKTMERKYWRFSFQDDENNSEAEYIAQTRHAFDVAMQSMDVASAKAAHLSGGLDSSIICALLSQKNKGLKTFSAAYPYGDKYDESRFAKSVAKKTGCNHTLVYPTVKDVISLLPGLIEDMEEPVSDVAFSRYYVAKTIKDTQKNTRVVYCGQGADELFGGYAFYLDYLQGRFKGPLHHQSYRRRRLFARGEIKGLLTPEFFKGLFVGYDVLQGYRSCFGHSDHLLNDVAEADLAIFLPHWLQVEDRIDAAFSMEVRYPFLCHQVVELASRLPVQMKICGRKTKYILREAFREILPPEVLSHEKIGFRTPSSQWFREELHDFASDVLLADDMRGRGYFELPSVRSLLSDNKNGKADSGWQLWTLLLFELWCRALVDIK